MKFVRLHNYVTNITTSLLNGLRKYFHIYRLFYMCKIDNGKLIKPNKNLIMKCIMDGSPGDVSEEPVTYEKGKKGWRMSCDVGEATEGLENEL